MGCTLKRATIHVGEWQRTCWSQQRLIRTLSKRVSAEIAIFPLGLWLSTQVGPTHLTHCRPRSSAVTSIHHYGAQGLFWSWLGNLDEACSVCWDLLIPFQGLATWAGLLEGEHIDHSSHSSDLPQALLPCQEARCRATIQGKEEEYQPYSSKLLSPMSQSCLNSDSQ